MSKLVVLDLEGDFQTSGFRATLEISWEGEFHPIKIKGHLPPAPELAACLHNHWQKYYRSLITPTRIKAQKIIYYGSLEQRISECQESAVKLRDRLTQWLDAESFRCIDRRLREELNRDEAIRFLIRTEDKQLHKLPWQEWDFFERYPKAEVALSATEFEPPKKARVVSCKEKVRILAILGNSDGINTDVDRTKLEALPDADVEFLVEPQRQQLNDCLWEQPWDILFFAGHSETFGDRGRIYINQTESLSIDELKYGLKKAIAQGLQLAIFNSCDGLGLAHELKQLHIPQMIVMREPVPDKVAQEFLNYFLKAYASGDSLYLAERQARERLHGLEHQFPCASWLPVICQNPVEIPPNWQMLRGQTEEQSSPQQGDRDYLMTRRHPGAGNFSYKAAIEEFTLPPSPAVSVRTRTTQPPLLRRLSFRTVFLVSAAVTFLVMGMRYNGMLEQLELNAYDRLMSQRPRQAESVIDPRILVVTVTEEDIAKPEYPLEDATVAQLLEKLQQYKPRVLGLDMHRNQLRGTGREDLIRRFKENPNFFIVCASGSSDSNYAAPLEFSEKPLQDQVRFSDLLVDDSYKHQNRDIREDLAIAQQPESLGGTVRRQFLSYHPSLSPSPSSCSTPYSLSFQLAYQFLDAEGIPAKVTNKGEWQFGDVVFHKLPARFGGYQNLDGQSSQIMINYRLSQPGQQVTLRDVLSEQFDLNLVKDRIVLIGYTAPVARDNFETPDGPMAGIWIHAHMVSQMLSAVVNKRPLIWVLPQWGNVQWGDSLWVFAWSLIGGIFAWCLREAKLTPSKSLLYLGLPVGAAFFVLYQICLHMLERGGWMPLIPSAIALLSATMIVVIYKLHNSR